MAFDDQRQMVQGSWKCADCGAEITELPFEPSGDRPVYCRDCHSKKRDNFRRERRMFEGNWKCADCGKEITQLPFEPRDDSSVQCRDCYIKSKEQN